MHSKEVPTSTTVYLISSVEEGVQAKEVRKLKLGDFSLRTLADITGGNFTSRMHPEDNYGDVEYRIPSGDGNKTSSKKAVLSYKPDPDPRESTDPEQKIGPSMKGFVEIDSSLYVLDPETNMFLVRNSDLAELFVLLPMNGDGYIRCASFSQETGYQCNEGPIQEDTVDGFDPIMSRDVQELLIGEQKQYIGRQNEEKATTQVFYAQPESA